MSLEGPIDPYNIELPLDAWGFAPPVPSAPPVDLTQASVVPAVLPTDAPLGAPADLFAGMQRPEDALPVPPTAPVDAPVTSPAQADTLPPGLVTSPHQVDPSLDLPTPPPPEPPLVPAGPDNAPGDLAGRS
jgi:hypothetical protein